MTRRFEVSSEGSPVLVFRDCAGVLLSTAVRPPGFEPPEHPFIDGQALDAGHEPRLAELLAESHSPADFITRLKSAGYEVAELEP